MFADYQPKHPEEADFFRKKNMGFGDKKIWKTRRKGQDLISAPKRGDFMVKLVHWGSC